jgi:cytochrome c oxidase assembly protein subunit 11
MQTSQIQPGSDAAKRVRKTAIFCCVFALSMLGVAFASVPLYNLFCSLTGYDGTPRLSAGADGRVINRIVRVNFDANVAPGLGWKFEPERPYVDVKIGEPTTIEYRVRNIGSAASTGVATFNVSPPQVGAYFAKVQCFCFAETTLKSGEDYTATVVFYVDADIAKDTEQNDLREITLSYTFFPSKSDRPVAAANIGTARPGL